MHVIHQKKKDPPLSPKLQQVPKMVPQIVSIIIPMRSCKIQVSIIGGLIQTIPIH